MGIAEELAGSINPFQGGEGVSPYMGLRVGRITQVFASASDVIESDDKDQFVGSVLVQWLDQSSSSDQLVPWAYPCFSNPLIQTTEEATIDTPSVDVTQISVGSSYGIFYVPSVGDLIVCGFRSPSTPVIVGYLPHNLNKQLLSTEDKEAQDLLSFGPFRTLKSGEFSIKSKQQAEIYLDRAGTIQLTVNEQSAGTGTPPIDTTEVPVDQLVKISLGTSYDDTFTTPVQSSSGQNIVCNIEAANGTKIQIDAAGNLNIQSVGTVKINNGTKGAARKDDPTLSNTSLDSSFWTFMSNLFTIFNAHVHTSAAPGNPTSIPLTLLTPSAPTSLTGKISSASGTVVIGD